MNKITYLCFILFFSITINLNAKVLSINPTTNTIQRVRIDFVTPTGYTRQLLLAFTSDNSATDDFDYGYDGPNIDNYPDDFSWIINNNEYVIQGVGEFNNNKCYPIGMFLSNSGNIQISLNSLENFNSSINVFIYDTLLGTFNSITETNFSNYYESGDYLNRFFVTFTNNLNEINLNNALSLNDYNLNNASIKVLQSTQELIIKTNTLNVLSKVTLYNTIGKKLFELQNINESEIKIPLKQFNSNTIIVSLLDLQGNNFNKLILKK